MRNLPHRRSHAALKGAQQNNHRQTILIALVGNVVIAFAKLGAGLLTGSAAMLAESGHSFADSINEVLLGVSLRRSQIPADATHPLGYGRERFLWAFMAAMASFVVGGCISTALALRELTHRYANENQTISWVVLAVAFVADGISWLQSSNQLRIAAKEKQISAWTYFKRTSDPILRAIVVEDSAALIGIALAACGLLVSRLVGNSTPDAIASLLIGILLALTAIGLARPLADFLVGRSVPPVMLKQIHDLMVASPGIEEVIGVLAIYVGPEEVVVAAKIRPGCKTVLELAKEMDDLDHRIREAVPLVADVFVDVTTLTTSPDADQPEPKGATGH